jgi:hypothetical protein
MAAEQQYDFEALLKQVAEAKAALLQAEAEATEELIHAKDAYRADQSEENRQRKNAAVDRIQALRRAVRADREQGVGAKVGGDAFLSPVQNDGDDEGTEVR